MKEALFAKSPTVIAIPEVFKKIKQITDDQKISVAKWNRCILKMALKNIE